MDTIEILPNAADLIESIRSIGYSFNTAIADIIDNSISAHATEIEISSKFIGDNLQLQIIDNGIGMDHEGLIEAMRLGSKNPNDLRDQSDLGRFGLGLKSASFSQCRRLTVITCQNNNYHALVWDLDYVRQINRFEVKKLSIQEVEEIDNIDSIVQHGTIVQWNNFDNFDDKEHAIEQLAKATDHIALIYHRYIEEGLKLSINGQIIEGKDPFLKKHSKTQILPTKNIKISSEVVTVSPYILPQIKDLTKEDRRSINGLDNRGSYREQGLYIYRNKRLIIWGTYLGLEQSKELNKNTRIQVDIPNTLDSLWEIDIKKSKATIPYSLKKSLRSVVKNSSDKSKRIYRHKGQKAILNTSSIWKFTTDSETNECYFSINKENQVIQHFYSSLSVEQKKYFNGILQLLAKTIPYDNIYYELAKGSTFSFKDNNNELMDLKEQLRNLSIEDYEKLSELIQNMNE